MEVIYSKTVVKPGVRCPNCGNDSFLDARIKYGCSTGLDMELWKCVNCGNVYNHLYPKRELQKR